MSNNWPFEKQPYKYGYINNPNWTDTPEHSDKHEPCGYWPVGVPVAQATKPTGGLLYGAGYGVNYILGNGDQLERTVFTQITDSNYYKKVSPGVSSTLAILSNGDMYGVGLNGSGDLGLGDTAIKSAWTQIPGKWRDVAMSPYYTWAIAIKEDRTLWGTGLNNLYQLGLGDTVTRNTWTQIGTASNWDTVSAGSFFSMVINTANDLWCFGDNFLGCLGLGDTAPRTVPVACASGVLMVSCGYYFTGTIRDSGTVNLAGSNNDGQFGDGSTISKSHLTDVSMGVDNAFIECGGYGTTAFSGTTFIIKNSGIMWAAGNNTFNNMGLADTSDQLNYVQTTGTNWESVSNKKYSTLALNTSGNMWGTGLNSFGELGLGDKVHKTTFEQVGNDLWLSVSTGYTHSMAINWDGTYNWG